MKFYTQFKSAVVVSLLLITSCTTRLPESKIDPNATISSKNTLVLNPSNTHITFIGTALANSHEGTFTWFAGRIDCPSEDPTTAHISAEIEMNSVFTRIDLLTTHLKSDEFFDVANYPSAAFISTAIQPVDNSKTDYRITGNLTLHGITKSLTFPAHFDLQPKRLNFEAKITLRQSDFGIDTARRTTDEVPVIVKAEISRQ